MILRRKKTKQKYDGRKYIYLCPKNVSVNLVKKGASLDKKRCEFGQRCSAKKDVRLGKFGAKLDNSLGISSYTLFCSSWVDFGPALVGQEDV